MSYHYYPGTEGRRYCYAATVTVRCPYEQHPPADIAIDRDTDGIDYALLFRKAHSAVRHAPHEDGRCRGCGARLEKVGYGAWEEEPWPSDADLLKECQRAIKAGTDEMRAKLDYQGQLASKRMGGRLRRRPGSHRYFGLKREAIQWAREQASLDRLADTNPLPEGAAS